MAYNYTIKVESLERLTEDELKAVKSSFLTEKIWPVPIGKANVYFADCEGECGQCTECKNEVLF